MKVWNGPLYLRSLCALGLLPLAGCSQGPSVEQTPEQEQVGEAAAALIGDGDGGESSVIVFGSVANPKCSGVLVAEGLVLTSAACAQVVATLGSSFTVGKVSGTNAQFDFTTTVTNVSIAPSTGGSFVHFLAPSFGVTPATVATGAAPVAGTAVTISGVQLDDQSRKTLEAAVSAGGNGEPVCVTATNVGAPFEEPLDEGAPVFNGTNLVGILAASNQCQDGSNQFGFVPVQQVDPFGSGTFDGDSGFGWVLGGAGSVYELTVFRSDSAEKFVTDTGIPKALGRLLGASSIRPSVTTNTDVVGDANNDIVVTVGQDPGALDPDADAPSGSGDGTDDHDSDETGAPLTLRGDMGMSFVLPGSDVLEAETGLGAWKGFPSALSAEGNDGKFLTLAGAGFSSIHFDRSIAYLDCSAVDRVVLDVFDANTAGEFDNNVTGDEVKTCLRLVVDSNLDGEDNDAEQAQLNTTSADCRKSAAETTFPSTGNNDWYRFYDSNAQSFSCASNVHKYRFEAVLMDPAAVADGPTNCAAVTPARKATAGVRNNFKIRTNCQLQLTRVDFIVDAVDSTANVFDKVKNDNDIVVQAPTTYDRNGTFTYVVDTGQVDTLSDEALDLLPASMQVRSVDADDCDVSPTECSSSSSGANGQGRGVHFLPFGLLGTGGSVTTRLLTNHRVNADGSDGGWLMTAPSTVNGQTSFLTQAVNLTGDDGVRRQDPSGDLDGVVPNSDSDEIGRFNVALSGASQVAIQWRNMRTQNAITHLHPVGSPIVFPILSNTSVWKPIVVTLTPAAWATNPGLAALLPIEVGVPGGTYSATTLAQAQALLTGSNALLANLTAATLNVKQARTIAIDLDHSVIRGSELIVSDVMLQAGLVLAQQATPTGDELGYLELVNAGLSFFSFANPDLNSDGDEDGDGIPNAADNCPTAPNPGQENNVIFDDLGDACDPKPVVECVVRRGTNRYTAWFGYDNPHRNRQLEGTRNRFLSGAANRGQPTLQRSGRHVNVFSVDFDGSPLTWELAGNTATASSTSPLCTGAEGTVFDMVERAALVASERVEIGSRFVMTNFGGIGAGSSGLLLGFDAKVGDLATTGSVTMKDRVRVDGGIRANGAIIPGVNDVVTGLSVTPAGVVADDIGLSLTFPGSVPAPIVVPNDGTVTLAPGNYGVVTVSDRATLKLSSGLYTFRQLLIRNDAHLVLNDSTGTVTVHIRDLFAFGDRSNVASQGGGQPQLLVKYTGLSTVQLLSSFKGTVWAPNAQLELVRLWPVTTPFEGVFIARRIITGNDTKVTYAPLAPEAP